MFTISLTDGEMYEIGDAIAPALDALLASGDPEHYEAKYGSASNLVSVIRKIWEAHSPGNPPDWIAEYESRVTGLRAAKAGDSTAARAVEKFKIGEAQLKATLKFKTDIHADSDGIRSFDLKSTSAQKLTMVGDLLDALQGIDRNTEMALRFLPIEGGHRGPDASDVPFSVDPVSGDDDHVVVVYLTEQ